MREDVIRGPCARYACRVCRTKTSWPHQCWCEKRELTEPECADCRYHDGERDACIHPARKVVIRP